MTEPDRPVTRRELRDELEAVLRNVATKEDLKAFATKEDLKAYPTREELKEELKAFATKDDLKAFRDDVRSHFDAVTEHFKSEFFDKLHDWTKGNIDNLTKQVDVMDRDHGARLLGLEGRVTVLETRRGPKRK